MEWFWVHTRRLEKLRNCIDGLLYYSFWTCLHVERFRHTVFKRPWPIYSLEKRNQITSFFRHFAGDISTRFLASKACYSGEPRLFLGSELLGQQQSFFIDQSSYRLFVSVLYSGYFEYWLEEDVQLAHKVFRWSLAKARKMKETSIGKQTKRSEKRRTSIQRLISKQTSAPRCLFYARVFHWLFCVWGQVLVPREKWLLGHGQ